MPKSELLGKALIENERTRRAAHRGALGETRWKDATPEQIAACRAADDAARQAVRVTMPAPGLHTCDSGNNASNMEG